MLLQRLAYKWGWPSARALGRRMSAKELVGWTAYFALEPPDYVREDWRTAQIVAMIFNMAVAAKDRKPIKHFLLEFEEDTSKNEAPRKKQTVTEQLMMLKMWAVTQQPNVKDE